jgi:hypothetical protein
LNHFTVPVATWSSPRSYCGDPRETQVIQQSKKNPPT